jgi:hypothetical protein
MDKRSFDWDAPESTSESVWQWGLRFHGEHDEATLVFAPNTGQAQLVQTGAHASLAPRMPAIDEIMRKLFPPAEPNAMP